MPEYPRQANGKYRCPDCGEELDSPQAVGVHRRWAHKNGNVATARKPKRPARTPRQQAATPVVEGDRRLDLLAAILTLPEVRMASVGELVDVFETVIRRVGASLNGNR